MSKKTEAIHSSLKKMADYVKQLQQIESVTENKESEELLYQLGKEVESIQFWMTSLYSYNGKSKSVAKKLSSRENGKKGGRPPKEITVMRRRVVELEETVIPQLEHDIKFSEEPEMLKSQLEQYVLELSNIKGRLEEFEASRS